MWWLESHKGRVCVDFAVSTEKQTTENFQAWAKSAFPTVTQWITGRLSFYTISLWVAVWIWNSLLLLRTCLPSQCTGCKFRSLVYVFHLSWATMPGKEINWLSGSKILLKNLFSLPHEKRRVTSEKGAYLSSYSKGETPLGSMIQGLCMGVIWK